MLRTTYFVFLFFLILNTAAGQAIYSKKGIAINGYDPVAYFNQGAAVKGSDSFTHEWANAKWLFSSKSNLESFKANPEKFTPQYGGWCAYGVSDNHKSPTEPDAFTIVGGKLYLNYNANVMKLWRSDTTGHIRQANQHWPTLKVQ